MLITEMFKMETFVDESGVFARLPASEYRLPRAKPVLDTILIFVYTH